MENLTGGTPPVRYLLCVVPCKLYFVTMKIKIGNPVLSMFGRHVFSVYILQHIPMTVLKILGFAGNVFVYFFLCLAVTLLMATAFDAVMKKLDAKLFTPKQKA